MNIFSGKVVIVTGAASGIGRALGEELADRGAKVIFSDLNAHMLQDVVGPLLREGRTVWDVPVDVTDARAVNKMICDTVARYGRLDYIFNNAGIAISGEVRDVTLDDWQRVLNVNLNGVIHGIAAAYPIMVKQGSGHIVNTASIEGLISFPATAAYVASKHAVVGLSMSLLAEAADLGVKVSVVCPGLIDTALIPTMKYVRLKEDKFLEPVNKMKKTSPADCASEILKGVARNKAVIVVTGMAKIYYLLHRMSPGAVRWMMQRAMKKYREARV
jgi:NAD(P)-dependent dehydrogenase (short-subunit alcohol dehydrogenase family)